MAIELLGGTNLGSDYGGTHIIFYARGILPNQKTNAWSVVERGATNGLGHVKWKAGWRRYSFFPAPDCVFECTCLREISDFMEQRTIEQRWAAKNRKRK